MWSDEIELKLDQKQKCGTPWVQNPESSYFTSSLKCGTPWVHNPESSQFTSLLKCGTPWVHNPESSYSPSSLKCGTPWVHNPESSYSTSSLKCGNPLNPCADKTEGYQIECCYSQKPHLCWEKSKAQFESAAKFGTPYTLAQKKLRGSRLNDFFPGTINMHVQKPDYTH